MKQRTKMLWIGAVVILFLQAAATHGFSRREYLPTAPALDLFPRSVGVWDRSVDGVLDPDAYAMLEPDDVLNRRYMSSVDPGEVSVFIAYYRTQLRAKNAHDPKVCLPGSGWEPTDSTNVSIVMNGSETEAMSQITANRYVVTKGNTKAVVVYWFQTHQEGVAAEQSLRFHRLVSVAKEGRSDMALVRIVVPVAADDVERAASVAIAFAQAAYPHLMRQFPPRSV